MYPEGLSRWYSNDALQKKKDIWNYLKKKDLVMYLRIRRGIIGRALNVPGKPARELAVEGYKLVNKYYGFNDVGVKRSFDPNL